MNPTLFGPKKKRELEIDFKTKRFIVMSLDDIKSFYIHNFKTAKEMWDTLEMMCVASLSIEKEEMNIQGEDNTFKCFSNFRDIRNCIGIFVDNQSLRIKNWKFNPILKSKDESLHEY